MANTLEIGTVKNAWPELFRQSTRLALEDLNSDPAANDIVIRLQDPTPPEESPPTDGGNSEDVWVYGDGNGNVLGIPKRGAWHFNRLSPGWPELVGVPYKTAIDTIVSEEFGVRVVYGPAGFPRTTDIDLYRVFIDVDEAGNVAVTPKFG